ncbi:1396_t:CDS:1, partial [Gigaspora margarita]
VDNSEVKELFYYINFAIKLPDCYTLSDQILTSIAPNIIELQKKDTQEDKLGITLIYNGWKNIKKKSLLEIVLINSKRKILIWGVEDLTGKKT